jgi:glycosyltransferase involved in cell wall biosynthesis
MSFQPAVDGSVFHARGRRTLGEGEPVTLFVYARPGHWRNCWELASTALLIARDRLGDRLRIVSAGSWAFDDSNPLEASAMRHLGMLEYRATGDLYRRSDIGLTLTVSAHPSYLPLEVMACGGTVIAFDNPAGHWLLRSGENCLLTEMSPTSIADAIVKLVEDSSLRQGLASNALARIAEQHADWAVPLATIHPYLCDPEGRAMTAEHKRFADITSAY